MTAETLKSFIPSSGNTTFRTTTSSSTTNSSYYKKNIYIIWLWICLILIAIITLLCILGFTIWNTNRISKLEKNLTNMYERLGLNYLDELEKDDFYSKNILDDTDDNSDEDILLDSYEDEHEMDNDYDHNDTNNNNNKNNNNNNFNNDNHDEQGSGEYDYDNEDDTDANIYDDNFYDDFGKFKKTKEINEINQENKKRTPSLSLSSSSTTLSNHDNFNDRLNRRKRGENYMEYRNQPQSESIINQQQLINSNNLYRDKNENRNDLRHMTTERQKYHSAHYQKIHHQGNNNNNDNKNNVLLSGSQRRQNNSRSRIIAIHLTLNGSNPYSYIDDKHYYNHYSTKDITETFYDGDLYTFKVQQKSLFSSPIQQKLYLDKIIKYENGIIRIKLNGIYLIYGQVYYHNNFNTNGFNIFHNDEPILQCVITIPISASSLYDVNLKSNTCYTSGIVYLKSDDIIYIRDLHKNRAVSLKDSKSFIGLIRLG